MTELRWPWLAALLAVGVLVLLVRWARRRTDATGLPVAHVARLRALPRYRTLARRELAVSAAATVGVLLLLAGTVLLAARPTKAVYVAPDRSGRDIMLCLDVSASMDPWNQQVVQTFRQLLTRLNGERLGLTIFSGSSVNVFPLTDDYEYIGTELDEAEQAFESKEWEFFIGAEAVVPRASQTGDGLMSCLDRFGPAQEGRGRAVILASDNDPLGEGIFTLPEAADEAVRSEVVLYALGTPDMEPDNATEFDDAAETTGGRMAVLAEDGTVDDLIRGIEQLERTRLEPRPTDLQVDDPRGAVGVAAAGLVVLLGAGFVGRRR